MMHKPETLKQNTQNSTHYLKLVAGSGISLGLEKLLSAQCQKVGPKTIR